MEVIGKIKLIKETQTFGNNGFRKREMVLTTDEQYPQMLLIEFIQDKCDSLDDFKIGQDVKISINLRGREWINPEGNAVYFNSIQGWKIESLTTTPNRDIPATEPPFTPAQDTTESEADDLPF
ncbi:MAG: DUF3127 domain-containing protein [Tenacibaculum sp.]